MKPINSILFLTYHFPPEVGGIQTRISKYLVSLSRRGIQANVLVMRPVGRDSGLEMHTPNVRITRLDGSLVNLPKNVAYLLSTLTYRRVNVVHVLTGASTLFGVVTLFVGRSFGLPAAMSIFGREDVALPSRLGRVLLSISVTLATSVSTNSEATLKLLPPSARKKATVLLGGADLISASETGRANAHRKSVLFVGRLVKRKGVSDLIEAMALVTSEVPGARLTVVGDGPERKLLGEQVSKLGLEQSVSFRGTLLGKELQEEYEKCNVFVLPSKTVPEDTASEGLGLALIEAAIHGKPLVGTFHGGIPEVISDGVNGLLVNPGEPKELAESDFNTAIESRSGAVARQQRETRRQRALLLGCGHAEAARLLLGKGFHHEEQGGLNTSFDRSGAAVKTLVFLIIALLAVPTALHVGAIGPTDSTSVTGVPYPDYGLSVLSSSGPVTLGLIDKLTNSNPSVPALEALMRAQLISYGIRQVLLDIGWQNFTVGHLPYEQWVSNWLVASDQLGLENVIYIGQLTNGGVGSTWVKSLIQLDPAVQTYYSNGTAAEYVSLDSPDVAHYLEEDLSLLYSYYGVHTSWTGIGTGTSDNDPYYASGQVMPIMGYSSSSVASFLDTVYYARVVNASGYLQNGSVDPLWSSYKDISPSIVLSSGVWDTSSPTDVFGASSSASYVEMRFHIPNNATELQIGWYGNTVGTPGPLIAIVFADSNGSPNQVRQLGNVSSNPSGFTSSPGWQKSLDIEGSFAAGFYWVTFSSPTSTSGSHYSIYINDYVLNNATALVRQAYVGAGSLTGSSILWIKDQTGSDLTIYPYEQAVVSPAPTQAFTATQSFSFDTVFLFLSDRDYNLTNGEVIVQDMTELNTTVATGILSQALVHGLQGEVPVSLSGTVSAIAGHTYLISITEPNNGYSWRVVLRGLYTNPSAAGFQGQSSVSVVWSRRGELGPGAP